MGDKVFLRQKWTRYLGELRPIHDIDVFFVPSSPTPTPSLTPTLTPTITPTKTITPTVTNTPSVTPTLSLGACRTYYAEKKSTFLVMSTISWNDCFGNPQSQDLYNPAGVGEIENITFCGRAGSLSYNPSEIDLTDQGLCIPPTPSITATITKTPVITPTLSPTITPTKTITPSVTITNTLTPTITPTSSCSPFTTQYMKSEQQGNSQIKFSVFTDAGYTNNTNAVCDYAITGTYNIQNGATNVPYSTTMVSGDHIHTYNTGNNITGFTITSIVPACVCVNIIANIVTPTPTPSVTQTLTPSITPSLTPTNTITPSITATNTLTPSFTPTNTITPTITQSPYAVCPEQIIISDNVNTEYNGTYNRIYSYTGGTFTGGYLTSNTTFSAMTFVAGVMPTTGLLYALYERVNGSDYYTLSMRNTPFQSAGLKWSWGITKTNGSSIVNGAAWITSNVIRTQQENGINIGGVYFPSTGKFSQNGTVVSYPSLCPTTTPTPSVTPTLTPTIGLTSTPTPSVTATLTPSLTQTLTPSLTPTKTVTPTITNTMTPTPSIPDNCCYLSVGNTSLDINIVDVKVSGVSVSYLSGQNFTIFPADPTGYFYTFQTGSSVTVDIYFNSSISGQNITLQDCAEGIQCYNTTGSGGIATFTGVNLSCGCSWTINASDGACV